MTFTINRNAKIATTPVRLTRTAEANGFVAADSDMDSVWLKTPASATFKLLLTRGWPAKGQTPGIIPHLPVCSRVYLPSIAPLWDGGVVVCMKMGCKEVQDRPFDKVDWGMYLARFDSAGALKWYGRYPIHKGNAQVVPDLASQDNVLLIASTGIAWKLRVSDGTIVQKFSVPMGQSGEKNKARVTNGVLHTGFVGYSAAPSAMCRVGIDAKPVAVASKPPLNSIGDDMTYADLISAWQQPKGLYFALITDGFIRYNFLGPKMRGTAKFPASAPAYGGAANQEPRYAPSLFQIPNTKKTVGVAFKHDGQVWVQDLAVPSSRKSLGAGAWPLATRDGEQVRVLYFKGNELWESVVSVA